MAKSPTGFSLTIEYFREEDGLPQEAIGTAVGFHPGHAAQTGLRRRFNS